MWSRRQVVAAGVSGLTALPIASRRFVLAAEKSAIIHMKSDTQGTHVTFDPIGLFVEPHTKVRWICDANVHTTTAYHPNNNHHSLRIPETAAPWNSDYLLPKQSFEVTLDVEGVYDYFCVPHEQAGMVGRIIVGRAIGPGTQSFDYFKGMSQTADWLPVPVAAQKAFPSIDDILKEKSVHATIDQNGLISL